MNTEIIFTQTAAEKLITAIEKLSPDKVFLLMPDNCREELLESLCLPASCGNFIRIAVPEGEDNKNLATATELWGRLLAEGATRHSVIVNLGGGMVCDLGGYVAACYMRGIRYINIPTTLLACVDAACGGKTAVNLGGVKNIVGAFHAPAFSIISPQFLKSLPEAEMLSGWGEMIKHALINDKHTLSGYLSADPFSLTPEVMEAFIRESVLLKKRITDADPTEQGLRRVLNLGHTAGHAIESLWHEGAFKSNVTPSHGHSVAIGLVTALVLSHIHLGFDSETLHRTARAIKQLYPPLPIRCDHYDRLLEYMHHDKKNRTSETVNFVLLSTPGSPIESYPVKDNDIRNALDITRDLLGL